MGLLEHSKETITLLQNTIYHYLTTNNNPTGIWRYKSYDKISSVADEIYINKCSNWCNKYDKVTKLITIIIKLSQQMIIIWDIKGEKKQIIIFKTDVIIGLFIHV